MTTHSTDQVRIINTDATTSITDLFSAIGNIPFGLAFGTNPTDGKLTGSGKSGTNTELGTSAGNALSFYLDALHTTGDMRGMYMKLFFSGAGGSGEAGRFYSVVNNVTAATGGTVNGAHISLDFVGASAAISGAGNALRATFGISDPLSTTVGGTCAVIQADTFMDTAITVPTTLAFLRCTDSGVKTCGNLLNIANVASGAILAAHTTQGLTHSIRFITADGTKYYIMCTNAATNRTGGA